MAKHYISFTLYFLYLCNCATNVLAEENETSQESVDRGYALIAGMVVFVVISFWVYYLTSDQYKIRKRMIHLGYMEPHTFHSIMSHVWRLVQGPTQKEDWEKHHDYFANKEYKGNWKQDFHELPDELSLLPKGSGEKNGKNFTMPIFAHQNKDYEHAAHEDEYLRFGGAARQERYENDEAYRSGQYKTKSSAEHFYSKFCHLFFHSGAPRKHHDYHKDPKHKKNMEHISNHLGFSHDDHTHNGVHAHVRQHQIKTHDQHHPHNKEIVPILTEFFQKFEPEKMKRDRAGSEKYIKMLAIKYCNNTKALFTKLETKYATRFQPFHQ